jgi:hypothetical protein
MMAGITSLLGIRSSYTEISDDEASDVSAEYSPAPTKPEKQEVNSEKKGKASKVGEADSLMVESEKNEEEDDDDSVGPDECVSTANVEILAHSYGVDMLLRPLQTTWLTRK